MAWQPLLTSDYSKMIKKIMDVMIDESCKYLVQMFQSFLRRYFLHITVVFHPIRNYNDIRLDNHFIVLSVHFPAVSIQII